MILDVLVVYVCTHRHDLVCREYRRVYVWTHTHDLVCREYRRVYACTHTRSLVCCELLTAVYISTHMIWCVVSIEEFMYARTQAVCCHVAFNCMIYAAESLHEKVEKSCHITRGHIPLHYPSYLREDSQSESQSESLYDWQSVSLSVLVSSPVWGSWPDIYFEWKLLSCLHGAPSLTRGRVCHLSVIVDSNSLCQ
jgi:hypothetical protein